MDGAFPSEKGQPFDAMSAGGGYGRGGAAPRRGFRGTAENAKTKLCTRWQQGDCRFGDRCNFAHGDDELRKLPPREDGGRGFPGPGRGGPGRGGYGGYNGGGRGGPAPYGGGRGRGYDEYGYGGGGGYGGPQGGGYGGPQGGAYGGHPGERPAGAQGGYGAPAAGAAGEAGAPRMGAAGAAAGGQMPEDVWAANGYPVQGPNGWVMYKVKETGEPYYHNHRTNSTQWERPSDWPAN